MPLTSEQILARRNVMKLSLYPDRHRLGADLAGQAFVQGSVLARRIEQALSFGVNPTWSFAPLRDSLQREITNADR